MIIYVYTYIHFLALKKLTNNQRVSWHRAHGRQPCVDHQTWQHTVFVSGKASPWFACAIQKLLCSNAWSDTEVNSSLKRLPYLYFTSNSQSSPPNQRKTGVPGKGLQWDHHLTEKRPSQLQLQPTLFCMFVVEEFLAILEIKGSCISIARCKDQTTSCGFFGGRYVFSSDSGHM